MKPLTIWILGLVAVATMSTCPLGLPKAHAYGEFVYPISGYVTSNYNSRRSYGKHGALDIATTVNTPVGAARGGTVAFAGWAGGYGNLVKVDHDAGYQTYYAHLNSFRASVGQTLTSGQTLGLEGSTGNSTGPHVHFEVRRWGSKQYLPGSVGNRPTKGTAIPQTFSGLASSPSPSPTPAAPAPTTTSGHSGWSVTASALNVRSGPSTGYRILGSLRRGERVVAVASSGSWRKIWFQGQQAWVHGGYLQRQTGQQAAEVTTGGLNVRSGPSTRYGRVGLISRGQVYAVTGSSGAWLSITWGRGTSRWCHGGYTSRLVAN